MRYVCNGVMIQKLAAFNKGTSFLLFPLKVNGAGGGGQKVLHSKEEGPKSLRSKTGGGAPKSFDRKKFRLPSPPHQSIYEHIQLQDRFLSKWV